MKESNLVIFRINLLAKSILVLLGCFLFAQSLVAQNWDVNLLKRINPENPNSVVWRGATASAYPISIGVPIGVWIAGLVTKNKETKWNAAEITTSLIGTAAATEIIKLAVNRERPFQKHSDVYPYQYEEGKSLPSGHVSLAFSAATSLSLVYKKWYFVLPAYLWAGGVSYSRLYLGEHYPTDVIVGAALGAGSAWLTHQARKWWFKQEAKHRENIN